MALPITVTAKIILRNLPYDINTLSITNILDTVYSHLQSLVPSFVTTTTGTTPLITNSNGTGSTSNTYIPTLRKPRIVYLENGKQK